MIIAQNRKARHLYEILQELEAGIELIGPEVKSLRLHGADLSNSYAVIESDEVYLLHAHIAPYEKTAYLEYDPKRKRKLLLNRREIIRIKKEADIKGITLVPTKLYFKKAWVKVSLVIAKGKTKGDRREALRKKAASREMDREKKRYL